MLSTRKRIRLFTGTWISGTERTIVATKPGCCSGAVLPDTVDQDRIALRGMSIVSVPMSRLDRGNNNIRSTVPTLSAEVARTTHIQSDK